jgi:predicted acylesterase/phospholipase RssA
MNINKLTTIVFSGGGIKCIGFLGVLKSLFSKTNRLNFNHFIGTSGGAIFAILLTLNYSLEEIEKIIFKYDYSKLLEDIDIDKIITLYGLTDGNSIKDLYCQLLEYKKYDKNITFNELYEKTNIKLTIVVTNFTKQIVEYINYETFPDFKIIDALMATCRIPIVFTPYQINDNLYLDGAVINNYAINYIESKDIECVIGILANSKKTPDEIKNLFHNLKPNCENIFLYMYYIFLLNFSSKFNLLDEIYKDRTIDLNNINVGILDFNIPFEDKLKVINECFIKTSNYLNTRFTSYDNDSIINSSEEIIIDVKTNSFVNRLEL